MKQVLAALLLLAVAVTPALAQGEDKSKGKPVKAAKAQDCKKARAAGTTCVLDMEGEDVTGKTLKGMGEDVPVIDFGEFTSLIRIRKNFILEMIKAVEDL